MGTNRNNSCAKAILFLCAAGCLAQDATTSSPVIQVTTRLVQISVVVHDKHGDPVTDLKQEDFVLKDAGKPQPIKLFVTSWATPAAAALKPLPPNIFSNRRSHDSAAAPTVTIILFDVLNTQFADQAEAKHQLLEYLETVPPGDRIALYVLGRDLVVLHDFTDDAAHLARTLQALHVRIPGELQPKLETPLPGKTSGPDLQRLSDEAKSIATNANDFAVTERARITTAAMQNIANHVAFLPGRKSLIWLSSSFPFALNLVTMPPRVSSGLYPTATPPTSPRLFNDEIRQAVRAMNQAGLAIYPVDARRLFQRLDGTGRRPSSFGGEFQTMDLLAGQTGGVAYRNTNDLKRAIRQAVDDGRMTYTLGFYPDSDSWDGKVHSIAVAVDRRGLDVRYGNSYLAVNDAPKDDVEAIKRRIGSALLSPMDSTVIGLGAGIEAVNQPKPGRVRLALEVDPSDITLAQTGEHWTGSLEYVVMEQKADGTPLQTTTETLNLNLTKARYDAIVQRGLILTKLMEPSQEAYRLRVVILDRPSGNLGSISIPIEAALQH